MMVLIVSDEEFPAEASASSLQAEAFGEPGLIFQGFERAFGERIVIGRKRTVTRTGDARIGEQKRGGFRLHRRAAIIQPPPEIAARQRAKRARAANKKSQKLDPRTAEAAGFLMLVTSLPVRGHYTRQVLGRYPDRWHVEIGFKRFKTLGGIDELPAADPDLARTWLLAHLIATVLIDDLVNEIVASPPEPGAPPLPPLSNWRVWAKARDILVSAILPLLLLTTARDMWRFKRALAEAPRQRRLRNRELRPP
jgi:hypothetical protein